MTVLHKSQDAAAGYWRAGLLFPPSGVIVFQFSNESVSRAFPMAFFGRLLAATLLLLACIGHRVDAQVRIQPFARPPVLPPSAIPRPLTLQPQPIAPLPPPPSVLNLPPPGPVYGSPPPPPLEPQYWPTLWEQLRPEPCVVQGARLPEDACEAIDVGQLLWGLRDPSRQSELLKELARRLVAKEIRAVFNEGDPLAFRVEAVEAIYAALRAEFDNVFDHAQQTLLDAPAASLIRRVYAIADAAAVEDLQYRAAAESRQNLVSTLSEVRATYREPEAPPQNGSETTSDADPAPERPSVGLFNEGLAYRQVVAGSLGRNVFDSF